MTLPVRIVCSLVILIASGCFDGRALAEDYLEVRHAAADAYCQCASQEACDSVFGSYYRRDGWQIWGGCVGDVADDKEHREFVEDFFPCVEQAWAALEEEASACQASPQAIDRLANDAMAAWTRCQGIAPRGTPFEHDVTACVRARYDE